MKKKFYIGFVNIIEDNLPQTENSKSAALKLQNELKDYIYEEDAKYRDIYMAGKSIVMNDGERGAENNMILDYQLCMLGLKSSADLTALLASSALGNAQAFVAKPYSLDDLLGLEYKIMSNVDYLDKQEDSDTWIMGDRSTLDKEYVNARAIKFADGTDTVKVVGVVRPKKGAIASSIGGAIGYTKALTETLLAHSENHEAVK